MFKMQVLVNTCFGGFVISPQAMVDLFKSGYTLYEFSPPECYFQNLTDLSDGFSTDGRYVYLDGRGYYINVSMEIRTNLVLIELYNTNGSEYISGECSALELRSVYVDKNFENEYEITDYDGRESIEDIRCYCDC